MADVTRRRAGELLRKLFKIRRGAPGGMPAKDALGVLDGAVTLIDLDRLFDLWVVHYPRLTDGARQRLPLKPLYFLAPEP